MSGTAHEISNFDKVVLGNLTNSYDANGQRITVGGSFARTNLPDPVSSSTYDLANQILNFAGGG